MKYGPSYRKCNTDAVHRNPKRERGIAFRGGSVHSPSLTLRVAMLHFFPNRPYYDVVEFDSNDMLNDM